MLSRCALSRSTASPVVSGEIEIMIVYAQPEGAVLKHWALPHGSRVADAQRRAALDPDFAHVDVMNAAIGIFGNSVTADQLLKAGDRIEIYRPLQTDPKAARRARAKASSRSGRS